MKRLLAIMSLLVATVLVLGLAQTSHALLSAVSTNPDGTARVNPDNGFPLWYQDGNGTMLQQCNFMTVPPSAGQNNDPNCILGEGEESFWWEGDTTVLGQGVDGLLVLGLEAAFFNGPNVEGDQISFGRVRIRADVPVAGSYTVTHPFGSRTFNVPEILPGPEINFTQDIGGGRLNFTAALGSNIGPFLQCVSPAPPAGYLGNANLPCTVTGSPTGNNLFRITGPGGINVSENQFFISGKLFTPFAIRGFVKNPDGTRAAGVTVTLSGAAAGTTTTAANGTFVFNNLGNGSYRVTPSMAGFAFIPAGRTVTINGADVNRLIIKRNAVGTFSISGVVKRNAAGAGAGGVTMSLTGPAAAKKLTATNGTYTFGNLANGTYTVTPSQIGFTFRPVKRNITINGANVSGMNFRRGR